MTNSCALLLKGRPNKSLINLNAEFLCICSDDNRGAHFNWDLFGLVMIAGDVTIVWRCYNRLCNIFAWIAKVYFKTCGDCNRWQIACVFFKVTW